MEKGRIHIISGNGTGKSSAALGKAIQTATGGEYVVIIQFLKGSGLTESDFLHRLEPEIKIFRFEKSSEEFNELSEAKQNEEISNIKNGLNFAKKVLTTGECRLLILDEVLGLIDNNIITIDELKALLSVKDEETDIIMTGRTIDHEVCRLADVVNKIELIKTSK